MFKRLVRGQRVDKEVVCECSVKMHCRRPCLYIGSTAMGS
jgi:hypothetical protein